jgi:hypothetical protein
MKVQKLILCLVVLSMVVMVPVLAKGPTQKAGSSQMAHLYLYEKDPATWEIVPDGKWGKMSYTWENDTLDLVCNAHGYDAYYDRGDPEDPEDDSTTNFTLIYYPDPWPGSGLICLGSGDVVEEEILVWVPDETTVDPEDGAWVGTGEYEYNVHIESKGILDIADLPVGTDGNFPDGAKIWLVLSSDVSCGVGMVGWNPTDYLFEEALVEYEDPTVP